MNVSKTFALNSVLSIVLVSLAGCSTLSATQTPTQTTANVLTDAQLIQIAKQTDRKPLHRQNSSVVGVHNGIKVIEEFQCSDRCPEYTTRIVHYDVPAGASCEKINGVTKSILVPMGISILPREYCFPKVIADQWEAYPPKK